jgi:hypothetical protein
MGVPVASGTLAGSTSGSRASIHKKPPAAIVSSDDRRRMKGVAPAGQGALVDYALSGRREGVAPLDGEQ